MEKIFEVEIAGIPLKLKSNHEEKVVRELVAYVDEKVKEALEQTKNRSLQNAAVLATLNIAEEFLNFKKDAENEMDHLERRARKVITELETSRFSRMGLDC